MKLTENKGYKELIEAISLTYNKAKSNVVSAVNVEMIISYWEIGKYIIEFEQDGKEKANYGTELLIQISKDLSLKFGKGFSRSNLSYMRKFYIQYPKRETVPHELTWSHYFELL